MLPQWIKKNNYQVAPHQAIVDAINSRSDIRQFDVSGQKRQYQPVIWIKITSSLQVGTNKQWKYAWSEMIKGTAGYGGWAVLTGGLSGTTSSNIAYNTVENMNAVTGTYGNGVQSTNLTGSIAVVAAPAGVIVPATLVQVSETVNEFWFTYENGVDGSCS